MSQPSPQNGPPDQAGGANPFGEQSQQPPLGMPPNYYGYAQPVQPIEDEPGMRWILPVGQSVWSIVAGYLGLFSMLCFPAPLAIIFSLIAIWHLRRNPKLSGWGRAIFGLVMGVLFTLIPIITLTAIAVQAK